MAPTVSVAPLMPSRSFAQPQRIPQGGSFQLRQEPLRIEGAALLLPGFQGGHSCDLSSRGVQVDGGQQVAAGAAGDVVAHQRQGVNRTAVVRDPVKLKQTGAGKRPGLVEQLEVDGSERGVELPGGGEKLCRGGERGECGIEVAGAGFGIEVEGERRLRRSGPGSARRRSVLQACGRSCLPNRLAVRGITPASPRPPNLSQALTGGDQW